MAGAAANDMIAKRYRLLHELGKGGMGTVWQAHDDRLNRSVALKLMARRLLMDKTAVERFEREAKAVARLLSPHIVQIYDYGGDPQPFMVMELLVGENLSQRFSREGQLPIDEVATLMRQSARGLASAHEAGIVHRDLKPGNLFIVRDRDVEYVKVVDFGIAKAMRRQVTLTAITTHNQPVGTPQYMSPNQLRAKEDHRDDIWSLAVIAYKALTGVHPFAADSLVTLVQKIMDDPHVPPSHYEPALPPELDAVFDRAFAKDREERFQSAPEFAAAIDALLTDVPVPIAIPSVPELLADTSPYRISEKPPPMIEPADDEESTTELTLVRPSRPAPPAPPPPLEPTLVDPELYLSAPPVDAPSVTPPPAATPWPAAPMPVPKPTMGPVVIGVCLSLVAVAVTVWMLLPNAAADVAAARPPSPRAEPEPTPVSQATPEPAPAESVAPIPSEPQPEPAASKSVAPPPPSPPKSAAEPRPPRPEAPAPTRKKRRTQGDDLFNDGPF